MSDDLKVLVKEAIVELIADLVAPKQVSSTTGWDAELGEALRVYVQVSKDGDSLWYTGEQDSTAGFVKTFLSFKTFTGTIKRIDLRDQGEDATFTRKIDLTMSDANGAIVSFALSGLNGQGEPSVGAVCLVSRLQNVQKGQVVTIRPTKGQSKGKGMTDPILMEVSIDGDRQNGPWLSGDEVVDALDELIKRFDGAHITKLESDVPSSRSNESKTNQAPANKKAAYYSMDQYKKAWRDLANFNASNDAEVQANKTSIRSWVEDNYPESKGDPFMIELALQDGAIKAVKAFLQTGIWGMDEEIPF
jgi:hypothetical protein